MECIHEHSIFPVSINLDVIQLHLACFRGRMPPWNAYKEIQSSQVTQPWRSSSLCRWPSHKSRVHYAESQVQGGALSNASLMHQLASVTRHNQNVPRTVLREDMQWLFLLPSSVLDSLKTVCNHFPDHSLGFPVLFWVLNGFLKMHVYLYFLSWNKKAICSFPSSHLIS